MSVNILDKGKRTNELITIKELFADDHYYRIPDYQRGYSWGSDKELARTLEGYFKTISF